MIWSAGEIVADGSLKIGAADRSFEHGLGLFETFRTRGGRAPLLEEHRARMLRSARELALPVEETSLPTGEALTRLLTSEGIPGDRMVRVTASGGSVEGPSVVWMHTGPLPAPTRTEGARVLVGGWEVAHADPIARHKSLNYWSRRIAHERAIRLGYDESLGICGGSIREGSRTNVFLIHRGRLATPSTDGPIVPGVMRAVVIRASREIGLGVEEVEGFDPVELLSADEVFLTNSVREVIPVGLASLGSSGSDRQWRAPGDATRAIATAVTTRLEARR